MRLLLLLLVSPINYCLGETQTYKHIVIYLDVKSLLMMTLVCELKHAKAQKCKYSGSPGEISAANSILICPVIAFLVIQTL